MEELKVILKKFTESGWDLIAIPSKAYLDSSLGLSGYVIAKDIEINISTKQA